MIKVAKDPICGMEVDPKKASAQSQHEGKTYYFCAKSCRETFEKDPKRYVEKGTSKGCCG